MDASVAGAAVAAAGGSGDGGGLGGCAAAGACIELGDGVARVCAGVRQQAADGCGYGVRQHVSAAAGRDSGARASAGCGGRAGVCYAAHAAWAGECGRQSRPPTRRRTPQDRPLRPPTLR